MIHLESSTEPAGRTFRGLLWGASSSRKTETPLRLFPNNLLIDAEGHSDACIGVAEIPPFLRFKTKDVYEVMDLLDEIAAGHHKMPDGQPIQTVTIDGGSVLWAVRQEAGAIMAEERARKRGGNVVRDDVTMTQLDWVKAKRPIKRLMARLNNLNVPFFFITAREKDLYQEVEKAGKKELLKVGFTWDIQRGIEYEMTATIRMLATQPWKCEVSSARGAMGTVMPKGTVFTDFPTRLIQDYVLQGAIAQHEDEVDVARRQADREIGRDKTDLLRFAREKGVDGAGVAAALIDAGLKFDPDKWAEMEAAITAYAATLE